MKEHEESPNQQHHLRVVLKPFSIQRFSSAGKKTKKKKNNNENKGKFLAENWFDLLFPKPSQVHHVEVSIEMGEIISDDDEQQNVLQVFQDFWHQCSAGLPQCTSVKVTFWSLRIEKFHWTTTMDALETLSPRLQKLTVGFQRSMNLESPAMGILCDSNKALDIDHLWRVLKSLTCLASFGLEFASMPCVPFSLPDVCEILASSTYCGQLKEFRCQCTGFSYAYPGEDSYSRHLPGNSDVFLDNLSHSSSITTWTFEHMDFSVRDENEERHRALHFQKVLEGMAGRNSPLSMIRWVDCQVAPAIGLTVGRFLPTRDLNNHRPTFSLQRLDIVCGPTTMPGTSLGVGARAILNGLRRNDTLQYLDLSMSNIDQGSWRELSEALTENKTLLHLELRGNSVSDVESWEQLGQALSRNSTLRHLGLAETNLNDRGFELLGNGLQTNIGLEYLDLSELTASNREIELFIRKVLQDHPRLREIHLVRHDNILHPADLKLLRSFFHKVANDCFGSDLTPDTTDREKLLNEYLTGDRKDKKVANSIISLNNRLARLGEGFMERITEIDFDPEALYQHCQALNNKTGRVGPTMIQTMHDALKERNTTLRTIVWNGRIDPVTEFFLRLNKMGRKRWTGTESTFYEWVDALVAQQDPSYRFYVLRARPELAISLAQRMASMESEGQGDAGRLLDTDDDQDEFETLLKKPSSDLKIIKHLDALATKPVQTKDERTKESWCKIVCVSLLNWFGRCCRGVDHRDSASVGGEELSVRKQV